MTIIKTIDKTLCLSILQLIQFINTDQHVARAIFVIKVKLVQPSILYSNAFSFLKQHMSELNLITVVLHREPGTVKL